MTAAEQLSLFDELPTTKPTEQLLRELRPGMLYKRLQVGAESWGYRLKRALRKTIGLYVDEDGLLIVAPRWVTLAEIEAAILERQHWISKKSQEMSERQRLVSEKKIEWRDGGMLPFLGQTLTMRLLENVASPMLDAQSNELHLPQVPDGTRLRELVQGWCQRQALRIFQGRVQHFSQVLGVEVAKIALSSSNTRWGTASADGSIRLNWRLIHFPAHVIDYVVAHEVAHLREMNHSPRFWRLVESVYPEHKSARAYLRREVLALF